jgi:hypothetical protein
MNLSIGVGNGLCVENVIEGDEVVCIGHIIGKHGTES